MFFFSISCVYELCAVREGLTEATGRTFTSSESWCQKKRKNNNVSLDLNGKRLARLFKEWRVCSTPCHTLSRVLSLASMYCFFIRSAQFHLQFFLCSFLIRKVTCSAGKFLYILLSLLFLLFVSFRFVSFPRLFLRMTRGFFMIIQILPKSIFNLKLKCLNERFEIDTVQSFPHLVETVKYRDW